MKMKKNHIRALALGLALGLAGCGGNQAAGGSDLEYIKEKGTMVIGYTVYEPMNYTDKTACSPALTPSCHRRVPEARRGAGVR